MSGDLAVTDWGIVGGLSVSECLAVEFAVIVLCIAADGRGDGGFSSGIVAENRFQEAPVV